MTSTLNLYESLANELGGLIDRRIFTAGDRLPSIRQLSQQKRVSISTVMQALRLLEDRGLVDARPQAGFYVRPRPRLVPAAPAVTELKAPTFIGNNNLLMQILRKNEAPGLIQMGSAWPPNTLLPVKRIQRVISAVSRRNPDYLTKVSYVDSNEPEFVRQIIRRALDWGQLDASEVVVTTSCTEAISLCLRAVAKPGDTIAIESATFFVLLQLIESLGMKALEIPTHPKTGVSVEALELAMQQGLVQACLLVPNVNNPLGCIMPDENKKRVAALLTQHDVPLIEDDIYGDLCFTAERPRPIKAFDTSGNVVLCSSFSKAITPISRVGFAAAGKYTAQVALLKAISGGATSHFFQAVLAEMIRGSSYDNQLRKMRRELATRITRTSDAIATHFPEGTSVSVPQGGFVVWVELPAHADAFALHRSAFERGVAVMPGPLFSASGKFRNCIRLNACNDWTPEVDGAIRTIGELVHRQLDSLVD